MTPPATKTAEGRTVSYRNRNIDRQLISDIQKLEGSLYLAGLIETAKAVNIASQCIGYECARLYQSEERRRTKPRDRRPTSTPSRNP